MHHASTFPFHSTNHTFIIEDEQSLNMLLHKSYDMFMAQCLKCRVVANSKCALKQGSMLLWNEAEESLQYSIWHSSYGSYNS